MNLRPWLIAFRAITAREALRFVHQRERFLAALVRPLVWLLVFAAGFRAALGLSIIPPYQTYITYETYIIPGLCGMILLSKLCGASFISILQVLAFLAVAAAFGIVLPLWGYVAVLPALLIGGLMLGALGLALSSLIKQLENFAGVMNFVIFPMFFLSSALYPLWKMAESSPLLRDICAVNPFTHVVELIRFALYLQLNLAALGWVLLAALVFMALALWGYDPARGLVRRKG